MYGKELDIEGFSIQQARIILFPNSPLTNLKSNTSSMFWITPIYKS